MKRVLVGVAVVVLLLGGAAAGYVLHKKRQARDIRGSSTVEFVTTEAAPVQRVPKRGSGIVWPTWGFDAERHRAPLGIRLRPPFRHLWTFRARQLVEFPPALAYGRLFFTNNSGVLYAISARTGKRAWRREVGRCVAASPAVAHRLVYQAFLNRPPCNSKKKFLTGEVIAFSPGLGRIRWRTKIGPTESSPLVSGPYLYVGDWRGRVYAIHARTGKIRWTYRTKGRVKGAVALSGGRLYVGSYDGHLYALSARSGKLRWRAPVQPRLGSRGNLYSTPAVAYGRVYIGSTDGKVYSFGATSGKLRWSHGTGGYVYGSPAVWRRLVLVGSYDRRFYAFDAATGDVRWRFKANGKISGSATVVGGIVYFSTLERRTYALNARTGRLLWTWPDGKYSPAIADRRRLYLVGYTRLYGLVARAKARKVVARVGAR